MVEGCRRTLRELREARGWSRLQLADQAGVAPSLIEQLERAGVQEAFSEFRRVVAVLGVAVDRVALGPRERLITLHGHPILLVARYRGAGCWVARPARGETGEEGALPAPVGEEHAVGPSATEALTRLASRMIATMDPAGTLPQRSEALGASPPQVGQEP